MEDNEHILIGRYLRNMMKKESARRGYPGSSSSVDLERSPPSQRIIDAVEERITNFPWSLKGKMANHLNDHFQLCAAAVFRRTQGRSIAYGKFSTTPATKVTSN